jgi:ABC-type lipoprotein export system ATPase subunit
MQVFKELNQKDGVTVVQVTHSKTNVEYGNRVVNLKDGWLI